MHTNRDDLDIPESTVWPAADDAPQAPVAAQPDTSDDIAASQAGDDRSSGEQIESLDPGRDDLERNAAAGGWEGANEQIENDFEAEQLRSREEPRSNG